MKKLSILAASLLIAMNLAHAEEKKIETSYGTTEVFSKIVGFSFPINFEKGFEKSNDKQYILELIPKEEQVENWTQMITITGLKDASEKIKPEPMLNVLANSFKQHCPDTFQANNLGSLKISGENAHAAILSCGSSDKNPISETTLVFAVQTKKDVYTIQWAEHLKNNKAPLADKEASKALWSSRIMSLSPIKFCDKVKGEKAPYPSCLNSK